MKHSQHDIFFPLLLLCLFCIGASLVTAYVILDVQTLTDTSKTNETLTTSLAYIKNKVQSTSGDIQLIDMDGTTCLRLSNNIKDFTYHTYIYVHEEALKEYFIQEGLPLRLSDGTILAQIQKGSFTLQDALLHVSFQLQEQTKSMDIYITER